MGILNATPDSFSDGGKFNKKISAIKHINKLMADGAKIIDVGGESTRPGSKEVMQLTEWNRIKNSMKYLTTKKFFISLDTRKSFVIKKNLTKIFISTLTKPAIKTATKKPNKYPIVGPVK